MKIYVDEDFICHKESSKGLTEYDVKFFDNKCASFIEGYRYIPKGKTWTRTDGVVFEGEMLSPIRKYSEIEECQNNYDESENNNIEEISELVDTIEELCNEIIGG